MKYRPEVDGLRAVAVLPVLAFHAGAAVISGGFLGVDVFFVISGYLIGHILLREIASGTFTFRRFYERRVRRILPAYFVVLFACFPAAFLLLDAAALRSFSDSAIASNFWVANVFFWRQVGYFKTAAELQPLLHMWSLAVEEQFYLFFPILLLVLFKVRRQAISGTIFVAVMVSFAAAEYGAEYYPSPSFYLLPTRAWELGIGALAALHDDRVRGFASNRVQSMLSWFGLMLITASMLLVDEASLVPGHAALGATLGTVLVLIFATAGSGAGRLLSNRVFVGFGLISYSLYLWHQPLFAFARILYVSLPPPVVMVLMSLLAVGLAYVSWRYVEAPFRSRETVTTRAVMFAFAAALIGSTTLGFVARSLADTLRPASESVTSDAKANQGLNRRCDYQRQATRGTGSAFSATEVCKTKAPPRILVWGDSFAMHLVSGFTENGLDVGQATFSGCVPSAFGVPFGDKRKHTSSWAKRCFAFNQEVLEYVRAQPTIDLVVLSSPFRSMVDAPTVMSPNGPTNFGTSERVALFLETVKALEKAGKRVLVVSPPPSSGANIGDCLRRRATGLPVQSHLHSIDCSWPAEGTPHWFKRVENFLAALKLEGVDVLSLKEALCDGEMCFASINGVRLYRDSGHLTKRGAAELFRAKGIADEVRKLLASEIHPR